jgi:hypothetical protein
MTASELLLDTDAVIKLASYRLLFDVEHPGCEDGCRRRTGLLVAAKFVARTILERKAANPVDALAHLETYVRHADLVEPTPAELELAASLEASAGEVGLDLDVGESQLCAIALLRECELVLTGDKRAITATEQLAAEGPALSGLEGRLACLEQAMGLVVERLGAHNVRARVVEEKSMDKAISISFQCTNPDVADDFAPTGLASYITDLRRVAPTMLLTGLVLTMPLFT